MASGFLPGDDALSLVTNGFDSLSPALMTFCASVVGLVVLGYVLTRTLRGLRRGRVGL